VGWLIAHEAHHRGQTIMPAAAAGISVGQEEHFRFPEMGRVPEVGFLSRKTMGNDSIFRRTQTTYRKPKMARE
jgi:hypothetical protein